MPKFYTFTFAFLFLLTPIFAQQQNPAPLFQPKAVLLSKKINTSPYNYAPLCYGDKLYFTTSGHNNDGNQGVSRLCSSFDNGKQTQILAINPSKEDVHASNMSITPDGKQIFYTLCHDDETSSQEKCAIWSRKKNYEGHWETASLLPQSINLKKYTATQPAIGYDRSLKKYVLYFVSDRPGGKGGKDIWASILELDDSYGKPFSLPFNTPQDEVTPYYYMTSQTLFFSSNGMGGKGGFDVFYTKKEAAEKWEKPFNPGTAVNSKFDETYFTFHAKQQKGYFVSDRCQQQMSSNIRTGIYEIKALIELNLPAFEADGMQNLHGFTACITDIESGQKVLLKEHPFEPFLKIFLAPNKVYSIAISKKGYQTIEFETSTEGADLPMTLQQDVYLFRKGILAEPDPKHIIPDIQPENRLVTDVTH